VLLLSHWLDLYDSSSLVKNWEQSLRILLVMGFVALAFRSGFSVPQFYAGKWLGSVGVDHPHGHFVLLAWGLLLDGETALHA
jgi:hypothetical protein